MDAFEHYMYVLRCADGTLYTGYAGCVQRRVAAHQAGRGAKYTKARLPVQLLAQARFFTKQRAMSAEYRFKQLSRAEKEALLQRAASRGVPLEHLLCEALPGFGKEPATEFARRVLLEQQDEGYRQFQAKLVPSIDAGRIVGVRTPQLRALAKQLAARSDAGDFLAALPHASFEENQLHAFAIGQMKDYGQALAALQAFLPYVDNWATCDQISVKILAKQPEVTLHHVQAWLASEEVYTVRFGIRVLMQLYLKEGFQPEMLQQVAGIRRFRQGRTPQARSSDYYLRMMQAWYFAEALAWQPEAVLPYLRQTGLLDEWTRKKARQKARESLKIPPELKEQLRA